MIDVYNNLLFEKIKFNNSELDSRIINDLIKTYRPERERMIGLWERYKGEVPIKNKKVSSNYKKNNKLSNPYRQQIISQVVGYMFGIPIVYSIDESNYTEQASTNIKKSIDYFNKINNIADLDAVTGEYASVCGYGSRLLYIDINGILRAMNINPWETIFVYDPTIDKMVYAIIYYQVDYYDVRKKTYEKRWKVELYDDTNVSFYFEYEKNKFELDPDEPNNPVPHMFNNVPVVKFNNNTISKGDFEDVETLVDSYDYLVSRAADNLEEFSDAYLAIVGGVVTEEDIIKARSSGVWQIPDGVSIEWLIKNLPTEYDKEQAKRLKDNIYNLSSTLDLTDNVWSGNAESGIARKLRMQSLESRAIQKERKFVKALYDQYNLISNIWAKKNIKLNAHDMSFVFNRDLPVDISYYGQAGQMLTGLISHQTLLGLFPFIHDPNEELKRLEAEQQNSGQIVDLNTILEPSGSLNA